MSVYLMAAELIDDESETYSCTSIDKVVGKHFSAQRNAYELIFATTLKAVRPMNNWGYEWGANRRECRVLALLFAHWMRVGGDL